VTHFHHFDIGFVVDASDISRIGDKIDLRKMAKKIINIDHHPDNTQFGDINWVMRSSCVGELIYDLAKFLKVKIDKPMADCLYTSIITDTGNFRYDNTNAKTFLIAAELIKAGVNTAELTTRIYDTKTIPGVRISARALSNIKLSDDRRVAWTVVTEEMMAQTRAKPEDLVGIVDSIRSIEGVEVAVFFREEKDKVKINFRSKERVNVSEIARRFNGGGHIKASGAAVVGKITDVEPKVIDEVLKHMQALKFLV
jgi:phosphoesterase RecJ-like protein